MQNSRRLFNLFSLFSLAPPHETEHIEHIEPGATAWQSAIGPGQGESLLPGRRQAAGRSARP